MTAPHARRRPRRTALPPRTTWDRISPHAVVRAGDLMRFAWLPTGWTQPLTVEGMVSSAADGRRTWFVSVDTVAGAPGLWRVRKQADSTLSGEPVWPADEQWVAEQLRRQMHPTCDAIRRSGARTQGPTGIVPVPGDGVRPTPSAGCRRDAMSIRIPLSTAGRNRQRRDRPAQGRSTLAGKPPRKRRGPGKRRQSHRPAYRVLAQLAGGQDHHPGHRERRLEQCPVSVDKTEAQDEFRPSISH